MNNYQQIKVLGEGGFGKAILVRQRSTGNMCVIKEVRLTALSQKDRNEATKEAKVLASLKHPNVVNYITSFQERGCFYIVMEYCDGGDLAKKIAGRGSVLFSEDEILHYFIQVSLAIKYIHDRKILHRDLKAQNIFLTKDGTAKLGDFGIARVLEHTFQLCRTQIGTPYYLSPEICEGKNYNSKTDIWSLGCILYELCTLKRAFEGCDQRGILMKIVRGKYTPISSKYSQDLRNLVDSMLTKEASKRPTINEILKRPFIQNRLSSMLEKTILDYEFSHTIIHGRKPFAAPTVVISKNNNDSNQNHSEKDNQNQLKKQSSDPPPQIKNNDNIRPTSEQRLIDQNFLKEQQQKKQQQQQQQNQPKQRQPNQRPVQNYPANVDPRYARRNYDIYGNQRNPKQTEEQERERQRQIEELKRRHQQDENDRRLREQKQQQFHQQLDQEREKRAKQREIDEYKRIAADREKQKNRLEQQKKELEEMKRLAAEQNRIEEEKRRATMEELRRQEEEFRRRREEAKRIMRNHEKEEERKQAEEIERKRLEEVERKRKEVEEMVKRRQAEADELKRIQEQKRKERMIEQQREREKLEADRLRIAEEEKARRRAVMQKQRELREMQKKDLEDRRKRQIQDFHQNAMIVNKNNQQIKPTKNETFIDDSNDDNDDIRGGYSYNDPFDPLEQTTADVFINKISQDGPAWANMPQKRIPIPVSLDQTISVSVSDDNDNDNNNSDDDEFASVQKNEFFDSIRSGSIKNISKETPSWAKSDNDIVDPNLDKTDNFVDDSLGFTFIDSVPAWAQKQQQQQQPNKNDQDNMKIKKQSSMPSSRLLPERLMTKQTNDDDDEDEVGKEVDIQMNKKFMEEDDNKLSSLHDLAMSIKQALEIPDEKEDKDDNENNNDEQIFFMNDEQVKLPVANDKKSLEKRQDAIKNFLEEKIGVETFIALNEELINKEADDNAPTPIISNLPPGIVCLAQQWLMLDATAKDQN